MALKEGSPPPTAEAPTKRSSPKLQRQDLWWVQPLLTVIGLGAFGIFATWRAFDNNYYQFANYLSPFYSPLFVTKWKIFGLHVCPALFVLPFPLAFRATCYYYRKAYYRSFFWDPPSCAVGEVASRPNYTGENEFPFTMQNLHRYTFYLAAIVVVILWWDTFLAFDFNGHFGIRLGSLIFLVNIVLLSMYTFTCHAWRHMSGGCLKCFSCSKSSQVRHSLWDSISHLNENHALWAWLSLFSVVITDLYVRGLAAGMFHDLRFF